MEVLFMKAKENLIKIQKEISPIKNRGEIQKIPLGAVSEKELKRELKLLKMLAADPIIKEMTRTRTPRKGVSFSPLLTTLRPLTR